MNAAVGNFWVGYVKKEYIVWRGDRNLYTLVCPDIAPPLGLCKVCRALSALKRRKTLSIPTGAYLRFEPENWAAACLRSKSSIARRASDICSRFISMLAGYLPSFSSHCICCINVLMRLSFTWTFWHVVQCPSFLQAEEISFKPHVSPIRSSFTQRWRQFRHFQCWQSGQKSWSKKHILRSFWALNSPSSITRKRDDTVCECAPAWKENEGQQA